jgi:hypothetical protein
MRAAAILITCLTLTGATAFAEETSCTTCHPTIDDVVDHFADDVHKTIGLSCHDCHGGNPDPALADDYQAAMSPDFAANPYRGAPARAAIPDFCGTCHSNPTYMKRFKPDARVDQVSEYWTSQHGALLRQGDEHVATCIDCHGVHGIRRPTDSDSKVYPTNVAETCRGCHGNAERMAGYKLDDGRPIPIDQYELWRRSVHAAAMFEREDLSAPTCNDCHGNHGARPPGLDSLSFVCGQCHGREASLFRESAKKTGFENHNELLANGGECADCHSSERIAAISDVRHFTECETCHGNHAVIRPTVAMLGPLPPTPCDFCHATSGQGSELGDDGEPDKIQVRFEQTKAALMEEALKLGLTGDALFDWLFDRAPNLPAHTLGGPQQASVEHPDFSRLWEKFRIGRTHLAYRDPATGKEAERPIRRCTTCHGPETDLASEPVGYTTSKTILDQMRGLTVLVGEAERTLLAAERGGVEVREAHTDLDAAIDAQIKLIALVHKFSVAEGGEFAKTHTEGVAAAQNALTKGREGLEEIDYRRRGLMLSLGIIVLVLIGLGLKIRQLSRRRRDEAGV